MKKKILMVLLCGVLLIGITGCNDKTEKQEQRNQKDERLTMIEDFAKYLDNGEIDKATDMIDLNVINQTFETELSQSTVKNALTEISDYNYTVSNIKYTEHNDIKALVEELNMAEGYETIIEKFSEYDFYVVDLTMEKDGQSTSMKDIYFIKKTNNGYSFLSSSTTISIIYYEYLAKENKTQ